MLVLSVVGAACSGGPTSSSPAARSTTSGTQPAGSAGGASKLTTTIQAGTATATVGSDARATVQTLAVGAPGLGAWTIDVTYDPSVASVTSCTGTESSACNTHYTDHIVRIAGAAAPGLQGDVTLMTLTFQCEAAGTSPLKVSVPLLADGTIGNPLYINNATTRDGLITCT